jgi:hypothetical protein
MLPGWLAHEINWFKGAVNLTQTLLGIDQRQRNYLISCLRLDPVGTHLPL